MDTKRYFFQCPACKAKFAADLERKSEFARFDQLAFSVAQRAICPKCAHVPDRQHSAFRTYHKVLGYVREAADWEIAKRKRLIEEGYADPCDGRCTHAIGPNCECVCGGVNHGTHRLVVVEHDAGPAPKGVVKNVHPA